MTRARRRRRAVLVGALVVLLGAATIAPAAEVVSASVAGLYVGEEKTIEGKVISGERDANVVKLQLGNKKPVLTVSLVIGLINHFPSAPETFYLNKTVRVTGVIESFRGGLEIVLRDASAIATVEPLPATTASEPVIDLQQRYDALEKKVETLERRLRESETPDTPPADRKTK